MKIDCTLTRKQNPYSSPLKLITKAKNLDAFNGINKLDLINIHILFTGLETYFLYKLSCYSIVKVVHPKNYKYLAHVLAHETCKFFYLPKSHCSRIDLNKILFPGTFFTSPHPYIMGTISICKKILGFTGNF